MAGNRSDINDILDKDYHDYYTVNYIYVIVTVRGDQMKDKPVKDLAYRHTPAFILLFLSKEDLYGASLLSLMMKELSNCNVDSAAIYRSLQKLEKEGAVKSYWQTDISGPAKKWYKITDVGFERLTWHKEDIEKRMKNFQFFIETYNSKLENR